jgi:hypothetical protein
MKTRRLILQYVSYVQSSKWNFIHHIFNYGLWEHPHDITSLPLFSSPLFLTALLSLVSDPNTKSVCNYFSIMHHSNAPSVYSSLCSALQNQAPLPITAKRSLAPSVSVPDHPSPTCQSTLTALAKRPFLLPQQGGLIQQATPTDFAN